MWQKVCPKQHNSSFQLWNSNGSLDLLNSDRLLVGCIYLSLSGDRFQSISEFDQTLNAVQRQSPTHLLVAGDLNFLKLTG